MSSRPAVDVVLPCLNEIEALPWVLARIPPGMSALVVDNGSTDGSAELAARAGVRVVHARAAGLRRGVRRRTAGGGGGRSSS